MHSNRDSGLMKTNNGGLRVSQKFIRFRKEWKYKFNRLFSRKSKAQQKRIMFALEIEDRMFLKYGTLLCLVVIVIFMATRLLANAANFLASFYKWQIIFKLTCKALPFTLPFSWPFPLPFI